MKVDYFYVFAQKPDRKWENKRNWFSYFSWLIYLKTISNLSNTTIKEVSQLEKCYLFKLEKFKNKNELVYNCQYKHFAFDFGLKRLLMKKRAKPETFSHYDNISLNLWLILTFSYSLKLSVK